MSGAATAKVTRRVALRVADQSFERWTSLEITRTLEEISGSFELEYHDSERTRRALPKPANPQPAFQALKPGLACSIAIDDETVLIGWIDEVKLTWHGDELKATITGRDKTCDLVDCAAAPNGPAEYRNLTLTDIARRICQPFGITVRADTDVGARLPVFSIDAAETALSALEKAARQCAVLLVSDGVGGLLLTRAGASRGPAPLRVPGNVQEAEATFSWKERFRDYYVKGQSRGGRPLITSAEPGLSEAAPPAVPATPTAPARGAHGARSGRVRRGTAIRGHARDEEVTRYRPTVQLAKTQSGGVSAQQQAEWMRRVARGKSEHLVYKVLDWRAGTDKKLWRLNELAAVTDPYAMLAGDMLIAGVTYGYSEQGSITTLKLAGPEAYDLLPERDRRRGRQRALITSAQPGLSEDPPLAVQTPSHTGRSRSR